MFFLTHPNQISSTNFPRPGWNTIIFEPNQKFQLRIIQETSKKPWSTCPKKTSIRSWNLLREYCNIYGMGQNFGSLVHTHIAGESMLIAKSRAIIMIKMTSSPKKERQKMRTVNTNIQFCSWILTKTILWTHLTTHCSNVSPSSPSGVQGTRPMRPNVFRPGWMMIPQAMFDYWMEHMGVSLCKLII